MAEQKRTERLFDLRQRIENGAKLTVECICADYDVDRRTVQRDLSYLQELGLGLEADIGSDGRKIWGAPLRQRKIRVSYNLTDLTALFMGKRLFDFLQGTLLEESMNKIYKTIEDALDRKKDILRADTLSKKVHLVSEGPKRLKRAHVACLDECLTALLEGKLLDIVYVNTKEERHEHRVEPLNLTAFRRGLYLVARLYQTDLIRIFALERIRKATWLRGSSFTYPKDFFPDTYFKNALFIHPGKPVKVVVVFTPETQKYILIRKYHQNQKMKKRPNGSIELKLRVPLTDELVYWILSFGANVKVESPLALKERVETELKRTLAQYESATERGRGV